MVGVRHEKYGNLINEYPFSLGVDIERTPYNHNKEQNWHENIEIELCTEGSGTVLLDGKKYDFAPGDIVVVNSNVVHYTFTNNYLKYTCLIISSSWCNQMNIDYNKLKFSPFIKSSYLEELIGKLVRTYSDNTDFLRVAKSNEVLLNIIIELAEKHTTEQTVVSTSNRKFKVIKDAITFMEHNYKSKITLADISKAVYFDKFSLCKEFKKYTGQSVVEYLNHYRSIKAVDYLREGYTVTETASMCGFENLSFFTRIFKRYTGKVPSFYKKR
jgi:AraC-like DNA-binding protein